MLSSFVMCLDKLLSDRLDEINDEVIAKDVEYKSLALSISQLYHEIFIYLPDKHKNLLQQYDDLIGQKECIIESIMYQQGVIDGFRGDSKATPKRQVDIKPIKNNR